MSDLENLILFVFSLLVKYSFVSNHFCDVNNINSVMCGSRAGAKHFDAWGKRKKLGSLYIITTKIIEELK